MTNELAIAGIQAILRLGQAGAKLYTEHANNKSIFLPDIEAPIVAIEGQLGAYLRKLSEQEIESITEFRTVWNFQHQYVDVNNMAAVQVAYQKMVQYDAEKFISENSPGGLTALEKQDKGMILAGGRLLEQWRTNKQVPSAFARIALTITDIGLEFVATQPELFGIDGKGEKFIISFAQNLSNSIPNDVMEFGHSVNFNKRVIAIIVKAGLSTIIDKRDVIFDDAKVENLVNGILLPVVASLPEDISKQYTYRKSVDALLGPSVSAALTIIANDSTAYLGKDFSTSTAFGAVTAAMLESASQTIAQGTFLTVFSKEGLIDIYASILQVAAQQPALFMNASEPPTAKQNYALSLFTNVATVLAADPYFKNDFGTKVAASIITLTGQHAETLLALNTNKNWDVLAIATIKNVTEVISNNLNSDNKRIALFGKQHSLQLSEIIVAEVAKNPSMLGISDELSLKITTAILSAMNEDINILFNNDEWLKIAAIAASTAVANKNLLLTSVDENERTVLLTTLTSLLAEANAAWSVGDMPQIAFGETLLKIAEVLLFEVTNNVREVVENADFVKEYCAYIFDVVNTHQQVSSAMLMKLVTNTIATTLSSGNFPTETQLKEILS